MAVDRKAILARVQVIREETRDKAQARIIRDLRRGSMHSSNGAVTIYRPLDPNDPDLLWQVAYTIVPQDGAPVVAEISVFPDDVPHRRSGRKTLLKDKPPQWEEGRWSGELLRNAGLIEESGRVTPAGGLTARMLRGLRVPADLFVGVLRDIVDKGIWKEFASYSPGWMGDMLHEQGESGRSGLAERDVQALIFASDYAQALRAGSRHPVADVAKKRNYTSTHVRDQLVWARKQGHLTPTSRGRARGDLTPLGKQLLPLAKRRWKSVAEKDLKRRSRQKVKKGVSR